MGMAIGVKMNLSPRMMNTNKGKATDIKINLIPRMIRFSDYCDYFYGNLKMLRVI